MFKKRKSQQLSTTVMVLVILALIVLVVLIIIFGKESSKASETFRSCIAKGGKCELVENCTDGTQIQDICKVDGEVCCVRI